MLYTTKTKKALRIAYNKFKHKTDAAGYPYIYHLVEVAYQMQTETEICVALLHDLLEDTDYLYSQLYLDMGEEIANTVQILTKPSGMTYKDYITNICKSNNAIAIKVKIADLKHNLVIDRFDDPKEAISHHKSLTLRYVKALEQLEPYYLALQLEFE